MAKKPAANLSTKILLLVVIGLAATAYFLGQNPEINNPDPDAIFPGFDPDTVTKIQLQRGDQSLSFAKLESPEKASEDEEERWQLTAPVKDEADGASLRQILTQMTWVAPVRAVKEELVSGLKIDPPAATLTLERPGEDPLVVKVGKALPDKTHGLVVVGRAGGFQIKPSFHDKLVRPLSDLRRRELFTLTFPGLDSLSIEARGLGQGLDGARRFVKKDRFWHIGTGDGPYADEGALKDLAQAALVAGAVGVRDEERWDAKTIEAYQLDPPSLTILARAEDRSEKLSIGGTIKGSDGLNAARFGQREAVYSVNIRALLRALGRPAERLRSRLLIQTSGIAINRVRLKTPGEERALEFVDRSWRLAGQPSVKLDQNRVKQAIAALRAAQILDFLDEAKAPKAKPELSITIDADPLQRQLDVFAQDDEARGRRIRRGERPGLVRAALPFLDELREPELKLRDRAFYEHDPFALVDLELLDAEGKRLRFLKKDGAELVEDAAEATTDPQRIQILTARLKALRAEEYVARLSPESLAAFGLDKPERSLRLTLREWREDKEELVKRTMLFSAADKDGRRHMVFEGLDAIIRPVKVPLIELLEEGFKRGAGAKDDEGG